MREIIGLTEKKMDSYLVARRLGMLWEVDFNLVLFFRDTQMCLETARRVKTDHVNTSLYDYKFIKALPLHTFATFFPKFWNRFFSHLC